MNYSFYKILGFLNSTATGHPHIKSFMVGDISEIDTFKQTLFPLCYLVPGEAVINVYGSSTFNFNLIVCDRVVLTSNEGDIDEVSTLEYNYTGLSNVIDVWNDTLSTLNDIVSFVQRNADSNAFQIYDDVSCLPFKDRFNNTLAGWGATITFTMPNDKPACEITLQ